MMKAIFLTFCLFFIQTCFAQNEPIDKVKRCFALDGNEATACDSVYLERIPNLSFYTRLKATHTFSFKQLQPLPDYQIISVSAKDSVNHGFDFYFHFRKNEDTWQFIDLAHLNGAIVAGIFEMAHFSDHEVYSILNSTGDHKIFKSREQFERIKKLFELTLSFDDTLIAYFNSNRQSFLELKKAYYQFQQNNGKTVMKYGTLASLNKDHLLVSEIIELDQSSNDYWAFLIRNTHRGSVGFLHIENTSKIARLLNNGDRILLRQIEDGWYLFKGRNKLD